MKMRLTLVCLALVLGLLSSASAEILGYWKLDEGSGDTVADISGYNNHGTIEGAVWVKGKSGAGLEFDGVSNRVQVPDSPSLNTTTGDITLAAWVKVASDPSGWTGAASIIHKQGGYQWAVEPAGSLWFGIWGGALRSTGNYDFRANLDEWHHVVATFVRATQAAELYVDGESNSQGTIAAAVDPTTNPLYLGWKQDGNNYFHGIIDEALVADTAYSQAEIVELMKANSQGSGNPSPESDSTDVVRDIVLAWTAGELAVTHDVYLGTNFTDVNEATRDNPLGVLAAQDLDVASYDPEGLLDFGQTYYWRVDEVNGAPDFNVFKGEVWNFTAEPFAYPIENIIATASSAHDGDMVPSKTIDGSGVDAQDLHSSEPKDMWLSGMGDPTPFIQYEFDRPYKLHQILVWNSNQLIESFVGLGAKDVTIETSVNGTDWTVLEGVPQFAQASGRPGYAHNTTVEMGGIIAQHVRLTINDGYGLLPQAGLSEVRFLYIPTFAREAQPADGAVTADVDVTLAWRAGREAVSHEVHLGTDPAALDLVASVTGSAYAATNLEYATTYYWQIVEVNNAEDPATYAGPVWRFSTPAYGIVDSFDQYDDDCNRIFFVWLDGLGHNGGEDIEDCDVAPYNGNGTGSIVGNATSPFAERTLTRSGQSLSIFYDNIGVNTAEAQVNLSQAQDWTAHNIKSLSLYFRGDPANTGQLYLKINNTKIAYDGLPDALQRAQWLPWNIDLSSVAGNLQSVTSLALGVEGTGASGVLYVDDIRVYPLAPESITPVDPDPANLVAHYAFDGDARDSAGGLHGTLVGNAAFAAGKQGQALSVNTVTVTDYVEITGYQGILGASAITVAGWINTTSDVTGTIISWGPNTATQRFCFRVDAGRLRTEHEGGNVQGDSPVNDGEWHHVAVTVQANATVSYPDVQLWLDGLDDSRRTTDPDAYNLAAGPDVTIGRRASVDDRYFIGLIDELYIYDRALSQAEIAGLAGLTQPFDKPFAD